MKFVENYLVDKLEGAEYNPRKISKESFIKLKESLKKFGVIIPVIINENDILIAGHQRTKAMKEVGIKKCPVYISTKKIGVLDEIQFNLKHNKIETNHSIIKVNDDNIPVGKFYNIDYEDITIVKKGGDG